MKKLRYKYNNLIAKKIYLLDYYLAKKLSFYILKNILNEHLYKYI